MTQKAKILKMVRKKPGQTATRYTRLLGFPNRLEIRNNVNIWYKPATILKQLHSLVDDGLVTREKQVSDKSPKILTWRFYPTDIF